MILTRPYRYPRPPLPGRLRTHLAARSDAARAIPHGDDPSAWIQVVHHACSRWAEEVAGAWAEADGPLLAHWRALQARLGSLETELSQARENESLLQQQQARRPPQDPARQNPMGESLSGWGYALAMLLLIGLEIPLVHMSFSALGLDWTLTTLLSLLSAGITAFLGHGLGTVTRHMRIHIGWVLASLLLLSGLFTVALAWLRESALAVIQSETATLDPRTAALALLALAVASLAAAAMLAWHHGVDPDRLDLYRTGKRRRALERSAAGLRADIGLVEAERLSLHSQARHDVLALGHAMLSHFSQYARVNQLHRDQHTLPPALQEDRLPRLSLPEVLASPLVWNPSPSGPTEEGDR